MSAAEGLPSFYNPDVVNNADGFNGGFRTARMQLPGQTWEAGNMFTNSHFLPNCDVDQAVYDDRVWWVEADSKLRLRGDKSNEVLEELFYTDAVRRLQAVEQLTLPPEYSTVPNTGAFSRFEHIWGSVLFVDQMSKKQGIDKQAALTFKLRTLVSDIAHTYGSHLGDWMFQGMGGKENQHDLELSKYLGAVGISAVLEKYNINPEDVIFPDIEDWVEASQPDLCVDRVDYGLREMNRWNTVVQRSAFGVGDFTLTPDGMLAMKDQQRARMFSEGFLLLSQENWSEPTHRFVLDMYMMRTKLFYAQGGVPRTWVFKPDINHEEALIDLSKVHPRDLMYVTDFAQQRANAQPSLAGHTLETIMKSTSQYYRQYVWPGKDERIYKYMSQFTPSMYADTLKNGHTEFSSKKLSSYVDEYPRTMPGGFSILPQDAALANPATEREIDFSQNPFKIRQVDPLVQSGNGFKRLSELDDGYRLRLDEHRRHARQINIARLAIPDPQTFGMLRTTIDNVEGAWQGRLVNSRRMTPGELRELVASSSSEVFGGYPFMTFLDY